jgi:hypothetical protein
MKKRPLESGQHVWIFPLYVYSTVRQQGRSFEDREQMQVGMIDQLEARITCYIVTSNGITTSEV